LKLTKGITKLVKKNKKVLLNFEDEILDFDEEYFSKLLSALDFELNGFKNNKYSVSIKFVSIKSIKKLSLDFLGDEKEHNVLSFSSGIEPDKNLVHFLGDIALCTKVLEREAREQNKEFKDHLSHVFLHGFLHLIGYEHSTKESAKKMERLEVKVLNNLGIENPY